MTTTTIIEPTTAAPPQQKEHPLARRLFTVDEILAMDRAGIFHPEERIELLDGEIIAMPPIGPRHEDGTGRLGNELSYNLYALAWVRINGPVRITDNTLLQPDIAVVRLRDDYHRRHPSATDVLLLVEVADISLEFDREVKLARYAAAGIPEVWIANLRARQVEGFSDPVDGAYRSRRVVTAEGRISPQAFPGVSLAVGDFLLE